MTPRPEFMVTTGTLLTAPLGTDLPPDTVVDGSFAAGWPPGWSVVGVTHPMACATEGVDGTARWCFGQRLGTSLTDGRPTMIGWESMDCRVRVVAHEAVAYGRWISITPTDPDTSPTWTAWVTTDGQVARDPADAAPAPEPAPEPPPRPSVLLSGPMYGAWVVTTTDPQRRPDVVPSHRLFRSELAALRHAVGRTDPYVRFVPWGEEV